MDDPFHSSIFGTSMEDILPSAPQVVQTPLPPATAAAEEQALALAQQQQQLTQQPMEDGEVAPTEGGESSGFLLMGTPAAPATAAAQEPGVRSIIAHAETRALVQQQQQQSAPQKDDAAMTRLRTQRTHIRHAIFADVCHRFLIMVRPDCTDFKAFHDDAWRLYKGYGTDQPERLQITQMLFSTYCPSMVNPPHILGSLDPHTDNLIEQGFTYTTYSKLLIDTRNKELFPAGNVPPQHSEKADAALSRKSSHKRNHEEQPSSSSSAATAASENSSLSKKQRVPLRISLPAPAVAAPPVVVVQQQQHDTPTPAPQVPPPPPPPPSMLQPQPLPLQTPHDDSFDETEAKLRTALDAAQKNLAGQMEQLPNYISSVVYAKRELNKSLEAVKAAEQDLQAAEAARALADANIEAAKKAEAEAIAALKQYEISRFVCVHCKKYTNAPILLSFKCGHICCRNCVEPLLNSLIEEGKKADKPVLCPCCSGAIPDVPQATTSLMKAAAILVPDAAKGFVDPFVLAISGKVSPNLCEAVALQQLQFSEFICAPVDAPASAAAAAAGSRRRPARSFCPKCRITPTYGFSNAEFSAVRCTNPACCVLYCSKCGSHPFHVGKSC